MKGSGDKGLSITTSNLSKRFNREWIFRNFNYNFSSGITYAITGPNGSGKSTFLQVLSAFTPQSGGNIEYKLDGAVIEADDVFRRITLAAPYMDLVEEFTLTEHLRFHFGLRTIRDGISLNDLTDIMQLSRARDKFIGNFSSGMKQRVKLALAFYTQAPMVLLDEPGTNLDVAAFEWYRKELSKLPQQSVVIIASNNANEYPQNTEIINIMDHK